MAIRLSGMASGLDTDSIVQELVSAYSTKKDNIVKKQTKLEWTQDAWKDMNTKIYSFYSSKLSNMRFSSNYSLKTATVSNSSIAKVTASSTAVNGTQTLKVNRLATSGYLTGGEVSAKNSDVDTVKTSTKLGDILGKDTDGSSLGKIELTVGDSTTSIDMTSDMTVASFVNKLKSAGVNASFDEKNQRFFISAKTSGADADFSLTASNTEAIDTLKGLGLYAVSDKELEKYKADQDIDIDAEVESAYDKQKTAYTDADTQKAALEEQQKTLQDSVDSLSTKQEYLDAKAKYLHMDYIEGEETEYNEDGTEKVDEDGNVVTHKTYQLADGALDSKIEDINKEIDELNAHLEGYDMRIANGETLTDDELAQKASYENQKKAANDALTTLQNDVYTPEDFKKAEDVAISDGEDVAQQLATATDELSKVSDALSSDDKLAAYVDDRNAEIDKSNEELKAKLTDYYTNLKQTAQDIVAGYSTDEAAKAATRIVGVDSEIELNGAVFKNNTNTYDINGLTIQATGETNGQAVTITTDTDIDGIYDKVKNFFSAYNELITAMDTAYNASSSSGYEPLTDDEKDAMTDTEIEKWEQKIKDSLLRRDTTLGNLTSSMKSIMSSAYTINGKSVSLSTYGIKTLGYYSSGDNEKGVYHIDGDSDDTTTSGNTDKLRTAIASDPDTFIEFFSKLTNSLYSKLTDKMATSTLSSAYTVYNDKQMTTQYSNYTTEIEEWEDKISDYEERYYSKFSAMETALTKLNSQTSSLSSLFG